MQIITLLINAKL